MRLRLSRLDDSIADLVLERLIARFPPGMGPLNTTSAGNIERLGTPAWEDPKAPAGPERDTRS